jgi:hypothetical protein
MQVEGKRRGSLLPRASTGARVSNAYPTCPIPGDNPSKGGLIPHVLPGGHLSGSKGAIRYGMGMRPIRQLAGQRPTKPTIGRGSERKVPHIGTETRSKLLREAAVRNIGQWARA